MGEGGWSIVFHIRLNGVKETEYFSLLCQSMAIIKLTLFRGGLLDCMLKGEAGLVILPPL